MGIEKLKFEQIDPLREYSKEVLAKMYPKDGKQMKITEAIRQVLINHHITDEADVAGLMREIGKYIKTQSDLKKLEREAQIIPPLTKEKSKEPYEDSFSKARRLSRERQLAANPLFRDQVNEDFDAEESRRGF